MSVADPVREGFHMTERDRPVVAFKWLRAGRVDPDARFAWPQPDRGLSPWVDGMTRGPWRPHGSSVLGLPYEVSEELWLIELHGNIERVPFSEGWAGSGAVSRRAGEARILGDRARIIYRIEGWDARVSADFVDFCIGEARSLVVESMANATRQIRTELLDSPADVLALDHVVSLLGAWRHFSVADGEERPAEAARAAAAARAATALSYASALVDERSRAEVAREALADERRRQADWIAHRVGIAEMESDVLSAASA